MILAALLLATQVAVQDPRLDRLDPDTRSAVAAVVDSARVARLPIEPIIQRALEGATKGAPSARIVAAVRKLAVDLGTARTALGTSASEAELEAAVAALRAGATPQVLANLRDVRRPPLTIALGAPPGAATSVRLNAGADVPSTLSTQGNPNAPRRRSRP